MPRKKGTGVYETNVNVMLTKVVRDTLEQEALRLGASVSTIVRMAIVSYFEKRNLNNG